MKKLLIFCLFFSLLNTTNCVLAQRFGYINSQLIIDKMPQYNAAKQELEKTATLWQQEIDTVQQELGRMRRDFEAEKVLFTEDMLQKRREAIVEKEDEARKLQNKYFGFDGLLFKKREELLRNIQDKIFEAAKKVARKRKIHFIFDKASDLAMIYTDQTYNFTDDVLAELGLGNTNIKTTDKDSKGDTQSNDDSTIGTDEKTNPPAKNEKSGGGGKKDGE